MQIEEVFAGFDWSGTHAEIELPRTLSWPSQKNQRLAPGNVRAVRGCSVTQTVPPFSQRGQLRAKIEVGREAATRATMNEARARDIKISCMNEENKCVLVQG